MPKEPPVLIRDLARKFCFGIYEMPSSFGCHRVRHVAEEAE